MAKKKETKVPEIEPKEMEAEELEVPKLEEPKETTEQEQEPIVVARAIPVEDMFNHINDKLNLVLAQQQEILKLAKEE